MVIEWQYGSVAWWNRDGMEDGRVEEWQVWRSGGVENWEDEEAAGWSRGRVEERQDG
jgi:hypothetical protein